MTPFHENWAVALWLEQQHGDDAPRWMAERIGALALAGDKAGIERWRQIAGLLEQLRRTTGESS